MRSVLPVGLVVGGALLLATAAAGQTMNLGTGPKATLSNNVGIALVEALGSGSQVRFQVVPRAASTQDQPPVLGASLPFAVYSTNTMDIAVKGIGRYNGHAQPDLRVAARLVPITVAILVRKSSKIATVADLKGKRFPGGYTAQQSLTALAGALLANGELSAADVKTVPVDNSVDAVAAFLGGKLDATIWQSGDMALKTIDGRVGGIRILPMNSSPQILALMESIFANAYLFELQPAKDAIGYTQPTWVMTYDLALVTSASTADDVVYRAVKSLHGARDALAKAFVVFNGFNPQRMGTLYPGQIYHPGAIRFYREAGIWLGN